MQPGELTIVNTICTPDPLYVYADISPDVLNTFQQRISVFNYILNPANEKLLRNQTYQF